MRRMTKGEDKHTVTKALGGFSAFNAYATSSWAHYFDCSLHETVNDQLLDS